MSTLINGYNVVLSVGSGSTTTAVAAQKECSLSINNELVEKSASSATAKEYLTGHYDWSMKVSGLYVVGGSATLARYLLQGTKLNVKLDVNGSAMTGQAYLKTFEANGPLKGKTTYSITLQGTGALTV